MVLISPHNLFNRTVLRKKLKPFTNAYWCPGSKRWVNAVTFWRMASQILGPHSSISDVLSISEHSKSASYNDVSEYESQIMFIFCGYIYIAESVLIGELHAQLQASKNVINLRHFAEELANCTNSNTILCIFFSSNISWTR